MKKSLLIIPLLSTFLLKGHAQSDKSTFQAGASFLPVYDVFKLFPNNKISGGAVSGNIGYFVLKNMSIGFNPYYAQVSNAYNTQGADAHRENQNSKLFGLNAYVRYYFLTRNKLSLYGLASGGFGSSIQKTSSSGNSSTNDKSICTLMTGLGVNYHITKRVALELNVPYTLLKYISTNSNNNNFQTVTPSLGVQISWP